MFKKKPPPRPTFVSFVESKRDDVSSSPSLHAASDQQSETASFNSPVNLNRNDDVFNLKLLSGEIIVSQIPRVTRFLPLSDGGVFGSVVVTNFRVAFISLSCDGNNEDMLFKCQLWNHKFIRRDDILLTNISEIYQVGKNKRKRLEKGSSVSDSMNKLEIFCKDFTVHAFSLLGREGQSMKKLVASIIQFVFPSRHELLFAHSFRGPFVSQGHQSSLFPFHDRYDWTTEMKECNTAGYRVTSCNIGFVCAESLPPCFAVPESLTDDLITKYKFSETNKSFPIWTYSHREGGSLIRMASESVVGSEKLSISHVVNSASIKSQKVKVIDLTPNVSRLPSIEDLQDSYVSLRNICMPSSTKDVWSSDVTWLSSIESTHWLIHISKFLSVARKLVEYITKMKKTVILKESGGSNFTPVISSLSQLMMEPKYRTIQGFQRLIDKEWVALGHRFCERLGLISGKQKGPLFHAFLDCVWQLTQQFSNDFEFTTVYLTVIYDSTFTGLFDSFIFDTPKHKMVQINKMNDKHSHLAKGRLNKSSPALQSTHDVIKFSPPSPPSSTPSKPRHFMNIWDWELQFSASDINWFRNPMFYLLSSTSIHSLSGISNRNSYGTNKNFCYIDDEASTCSTTTTNCDCSFNNSGKKRFSNLFKSCNNSRTSFPAESPTPSSSIFYKSSLFPDATFLRRDDDQQNLSARTTTSLSSSEMSSLKNDPSDGNLDFVQRSSFILVPEVSMPCLKLWDHCYLRWIGPLELIGGGHFAEYFTQIQLILDITSLHEHISKMECQINLLGSSESESSGYPCPDDFDSHVIRHRVDESKLENESRTNENSSFYVTNFLVEPDSSAQIPTVLNSSPDIYLQDSSSQLCFPTPPECFTSSFPYVVERPPTTFATPMTFSGEGQRASYIDSDLASIDEMSSSYISSC